jgi:hypothetical protein
MKKYSFAKGVRKGFLAALTAASAMIAFAGFSEITLWDLAVEHIKPLLGSLTVGGVMAMIINYVKIRSQED